MFRSSPEDEGRTAAWPLAGVLLTTVIAAACGAGHHLGEYEFDQQTLAVVDYAPPAPDLWTGGYGTSGAAGTLQKVLTAGSRVAVEVEIRHARSRLDSAAQLVDVREQLSRRTLERAARYLGATSVAEPEQADYLLEVRVRQFGIDASGGLSIYAVMNAEAVLLSRDFGDEIWRVEVDTHDRLTPYVSERSIAPSDAVSAGVLTTVSVDDFRRVLAGLTDYTADHIADQLRADLRDVREDGG